MTSNTQQLERVIEALDRVPQETKEMVFNLTKKLSDIEIIRLFNQQSLDFFRVIIEISRRIGREDECKFNGYKLLFDNALKINARLPLDKFTLVILEFAPEIYEENEDCFLNMSIPDTKVQVGNGFGFIRSEKFKSMWLILNDKDKNAFKEVIIPLTTYAHAFLYKTILQHRS